MGSAKAGNLAALLTVLPAQNPLHLEHLAHTLKELLEPQDSTEDSWRGCNVRSA